MLLYHGTNEKYLEEMLKNGISPRRERKSQWKTAASHPDMVYLSRAYPFYFAAMVPGKGRLAVLEFDLADLGEKKMYPDEDFLTFRTGHILNLRGEALLARHGDSLKSLGTPSSHKFWQASLNGLGNCCYKGTIPPKKVRRVCLYDPNVKRPFISSLATDPSINPMNYLLCGDEYRQFVAWMFGDVPNLPNRFEGISDLTKERDEAIKRESADRTGIEVLTGEQFLATSGGAGV